MGQYTRMKFASMLRSDIPSEVIELLSTVAVGDWSRAKAIAPQHEFFKAERWEGLLCGTYAAPSWPEADGCLAIERNACGAFNFAFHSSTKNYDGEIDKFLSWIGPYLESVPGELLGEIEGEDDDRPTLLVAQVARIDKLYLPDDDESSPSIGYYCRGKFG